MGCFLSGGLGRTSRQPENRTSGAFWLIAAPSQNGPRTKTEPDMGQCAIVAISSETMWWAIGAMTLLNILSLILNFRR